MSSSTRSGLSRCGLWRSLLSLSPAAMLRPATRPRRPAKRRWQCLRDRGRLLLIATLFIGTGCFGGETASLNSDDDLSSITSIAESVSLSSTYASTAYAAIEPRIGDYLDDGLAAVVVPSDDALLALDADALAEIASAGSIDSLVVALPPADEIDFASILSSEWEEFVFDRRGDAHLVRAGSGVATIGGATIVAVEEIDGLTVIVIDEILDRRETSS